MIRNTHYAFALHRDRELTTITCAQCLESLYFTGQATPEAINAAKTAHRIHCALRICCVCKTTIATGEAVTEPTIDSSHGFCAPCGEAEIAKVILFNRARTAELKTAI